ncbi:MAG: hypothetical protein EX271_10665 [Acidimicrobiales bacterium]|nr:hypothetical protein [Hyphomonadaceae bacterium]RZV39538.1 MAG: hypothetical protein EX271_10665 [Acidimicrobiales bacterium]
MGANHKLWMVAAGLTLVLAACQTPYEIGDASFGPAETTNSSLPENNASGYVPAVDFLGDELMKSDLHEVQEQAWNDGYTNTYKIITDKHVYYAQGTQMAKKRIFEIEATDTLRKQTPLHAAGGTILDRGANLVETPIRAIAGARARNDKARSINDKLMMVPTGIGGVLRDLGGGLKQIGVTGLRITRGVGGTRCSGVGQCIGKAGRDIWSGMNSITGKHEASRLVHRTVGTDPYTDNKVLQNQVDKLAYTNAYTGLGFKFGLANAGIAFVSPYVSGVGYYNNVEFFSQYEDAEKRRNIEKEMLLNDWELEQSVIDEFYGNKNYTDTTRTQFLIAATKLSSQDARNAAIIDAATSETRYVAESKLSIYQYVANLDEAGDVDGYVDGTASPIVALKTGTLVLPFMGDYISWTEEIAEPITMFADLAGPDKQYTNAEIHVLGLTSPEFKQRAEALRLTVAEID